MGADKLFLTNPDELALKTAYRSVSKNGEFNISASSGNLVSILKSMESVGFIAIEIISINNSTGTVNIRAFKGKNGPCYNTGRFAQYKGSALAALDDDNHFLPANEKIPVCEKTANIYKLPAYENLIECSDTDPLVTAKNDGIPELFNCDTFEEDQTSLFKKLKNKESEKGTVCLFYPGPFRLLILNDGRIIRRGHAILIPESEVTILKKTDKLFAPENCEPLQPLFFSDAYAAKGSGWLLEAEVQRENIAISVEADLRVLNSISPELKGHLVQLITGKKKYFILTGSDTGDKLGCCPSEVVTEANKLKRAGILEVAQQAGPDESCPLSVFAFRGEIQQVGNDLQFNINSNFREKIFKKLQPDQKKTFRRLTRWVLLAFISISLVTAFFKLQNTSQSPLDLSLYEQLAPGNRNQQMVLLFHFSERCEMCLTMEKYAQEVLATYYPELLKSKKVEFRLIAMDLPENKGLVEKFGVFSTTLVLVSFEDKQEIKSIALNDIWELYRDEDLFKATLKKELDNFLGSQNE